MPSASYNSGSPSTSSNQSSSPVPPPTATSTSTVDASCTAKNHTAVTATASQSHSSPPTTAPTAAVAEKEKPRLTEQEKKTNHIASEQKRRAAIREGFDRLTELVPGLEGQGRSESVVLRKSVDFMRVKLQERRDLITEIETQGGRIDESMRR
jgi:heteromeric Ino2p/Ino4p transcription factor